MSQERNYSDEQATFERRAKLVRRHVNGLPLTKSDENEARKVMRAYKRGEQWAVTTVLMAEGK